MKTLRKMFALIAGISVLFTAVQPALALQVKKLSVTLSDSRGGESATHTWAFTHTQSATIKSFTLAYCRQPSGTCVAPSGLVTSGASKGALSNLGAEADWSLNTAGDSPRLENTTANGFGMPAGQIVTINLGSVTNNPISGSNCTIAAGNSSATCYVQLSSYTSVDGLSGLVDEGIASYTIIAATTISARVDPTFTFVVSSVNASTALGGATTSVGSTYNTLNFGNLTAGTPKYAAHQLNVTTNTENGYTVSVKMHTQMAGVYTNNNIDPFFGSSAAWGTPQDWSEPNGQTANDNTGWIGANTTDQDINGWSGNTWGKFGPVGAGANVVMLGTRSDNGANAVYVTYAIEANVFQPADTYTGTIVYNALPTY